MSTRTVIGHRATPVTIAITFDDGPRIISNDHPAFADIKRLLNEGGDADEIYNLCTPKAAIHNYLGGMAQVTDDGVIIDGRRVENVVVPIIIGMSKAGEDPSTLISFLKLLTQNPSMRSRDQLWNFIERNNVTLFGVPGPYFGWMVLYKGVREDYKDQHSGTFDNTPGNVLSMARHDVNDDPNVACSYGFHAGAYDYVKSFGYRKLIVLVNPANVVSVPLDSNCQKIRTTSYYVYKELPRENFVKIEDQVYYDDEDCESWDEYEDEDTYSYRVEYSDARGYHHSCYIDAADSEDARQYFLDNVANEGDTVLAVSYAD